MLRLIASAFVLGGISTTAIASPKIVVHPVQLGSESIRYNHGVATIDQFSANGSVQVRPAQMEHGSLVFNVAVFNDGQAPQNIDVTNFSLNTGAVQVAAMTVDTLEKKAKSRAAWSQFAVALAGGLSAAAAASQRDTYRSSLYTPRGVYHSTFSAPSAYGQAQAVAIAAGTGVGIAAIQNRLDRTLEDLGDQIVQLSTVDPQQSYAGKVVFEKVKLKKLPAQVTMSVDWNGTIYPFTFLVAKRGTPAPAFKPASLALPANAATSSLAEGQETSSVEVIQSVGQASESAMTAEPKAPTPTFAPSAAVGAPAPATEQSPAVASVG